MVTVARRSPRTGLINTMELDISDAQILLYRSGALLQDAFPNLTAAEREFYKTGYTAEDWAIIFPPEEDDE